MLPPRPSLRAFLRLYAEGDFWESHEVLERPWRETGDPFTQALILLASAWVHWQRGNAHGVKAQLDKTLRRLDSLPDGHMGFDVAALRRCCREVPVVVDTHPGDWPERVRPLRLVPPIAPTPGPIRVEACVTSVEEAESCVAAGAHRVELCRDLQVGGLTPERELVRKVVEAVDVPVHVLVRLRGDRWFATPDELDEMIDGVRAARAAGAAGVVVGALLPYEGSVSTGDSPTPDRSVDLAAVEALVAAAAELSVTFHRAFDLVGDPVAALHTLADAGVERVLTSGGAADASSGATRLLELQRAAPSGCGVLAGGGIRGDHVVPLVDATGVGEVHCRAAGVAGVCEALRAEALLDRG